MSLSRVNKSNNVEVLMFSKVVKWLFSATPVIKNIEKKEESRTEKLIKITGVLTNVEGLSKEATKPDSRIYPIHVHTTTVRSIIDIGKVIYYKTGSSDVYLPMSGNRVMVDLGSYLKFGGKSIEVSLLLENFLIILNHYNEKKSLSYREKFVLEDIACLLDVFCYLVDMEKEK